MLSRTNPARTPHALIAKATRPRTHAALLTALALAAAAGCSGTGDASSAGAASSAKSSSSSGPTADQRAVAAMAVRTLHDFGTNNYADLCAMLAPGSTFLATGVEGCAEQIQLALTSAGGQPGLDAFLSEASDLTVDASEVVIDGDSATVPKTAYLYQGKPITQFASLNSATLTRKNGQWYLVMGD